MSFEPGAEYRLDLIGVWQADVVEDGNANVMFEIRQFVASFHRVWPPGTNTSCDDFIKTGTGSQTMTRELMVTVLVFLSPKFITTLHYVFGYSYDMWYILYCTVVAYEVMTRLKNWLSYSCWCIIYRATYIFTLYCTSISPYTYFEIFQTKCFQA